MVYSATHATAGRVAELASAGQLEHPSGGRLASFEVPEDSVRSIARREQRKQAAAEATAGLVGMRARDVVEMMRRRLVVALATEFDGIEIEQDAGRPAGFEMMRQAARAIRELAAVPGLDEPRPPRPGTKVNGVGDDSETRGGLAAKAIAALREGGLSVADDASDPAPPHDTGCGAPMQADAQPE